MNSASPTGRSGPRDAAVRGSVYNSSQTGTHGACSAEKINSPDEAFERDIPESEREGILQRIEEAVWGSDDPDISVISAEKRDACNIVAEGGVQHNGQEYWFHVESGNWNGFVLRGWENAGEDYEPPRPTVHALAPPLDLIQKRIWEGRPALLLKMWDGMLSEQPDLAGIPRKYDYDRFFQPGLKTESHWREKASSRGFDLVSEEEAKERREMLMEAAHSPKGADTHPEGAHKETPHDQ